MPDNNESSMPKYLVLKNYIVDNIESGEFPTDSQIPSENEIAKQFGVSIVTARKALSDLVYEGLIYRIRGKGSFVSKTRMQSENKKLRIITFLVLTDETSDGSFMRLIRGAQSYLSAKGYSLLVECCNNNVETERKIIDRCVDNGMAGVLVFSVDPDANVESYESLERNGTPFVMIDRATSKIPVNLVSSFNFDGAFRMTEYLIGLEHKKIVFAASNGKVETEQNRLAGYHAALSKAGMDIDSSLYIDDTPNNLNEIYSLVKEKKATAVMCVNDACANSVINHLKKMGLKIPSDVSVTGFDGAEIGSYLTPSLTTVKQSFSEMGRAAAKMLVNSIENMDLGYSRILLPTEVVIRESTGPAPVMDGICFNVVKNAV